MTFVNCKLNINVVLEGLKESKEIEISNEQVNFLKLGNKDPITLPKCIYSKIDYSKYKG